LKCPTKSEKPVCGKDGVTYKSFCQLQLQACNSNKDIGFDCDGACPCGN